MTPEAILSHHDQGTLWPQERQVPADLPAAYETARQLRALREARGERVVGYKVGFTNRTIWERYQVFAPIWGPVWNTTLTQCEGQGTVDLTGTSLPRIEPEIVFGLSRTPPVNPSAQEVFGCIEWMAPGFEVVQSHCADWKFSAPETVIDGGLHARLLVSRRRAVRVLAPDAAALDALLAPAQLELFQGDDVIERGTGSHVLDSPQHALRHFVWAFQASGRATTLQPGDVVTTGTWTDAWPVAPGQTWHLRFDIGIDPLRVTFR